MFMLKNIAFPTDSGTKGQSRKLCSEPTVYLSRSIGWLEVWGVAAASLIACLSALAQQPPEITTQPQSQTITNGNNALFTVTAQGHKPLSYQWLFNALPIAGATNSDLALTNVQCSNAGIYSITV